MRALAHLRIFFLFLAMLLFAGGCGYHVAGKGGKMPGGVASVSIPVFLNNTAKPGIEGTITGAFVSEFMNTVSVSDTADAVMEGVIKSYSLTAVSFTKSDINQEYRLTVILSIRMKSLKDDKVFWEDLDVTDYEDYAVNASDVTATKEAEFEAFRKLSKDTARRIKERMLEMF
ncbi:MAG: hypothetical protein HY884_04970 [Deltaproteobacteria bacterium]|nr:hypothetical protein [Deltaproteobacteria bacterium]